MLGSTGEKTLMAHADMEQGARATRLLSKRRFAQALGLGESTVQREIQRGRIAVVRINRRVLIPVEELDRLIGVNLQPAREAGTAKGA